MRAGHYDIRHDMMLWHPQAGDHSTILEVLMSRHKDSVCGHRFLMQMKNLPDETGAIILAHTSNGVIKLYSKIPFEIEDYLQTSQIEIANASHTKNASQP